MEWIIIIATLLGGLAAIFYFWDKIRVRVFNKNSLTEFVLKPKKDDKKHLLFLSHSGEDSENARELAGQLREVGMNVWLDVDNLKPGDLWQKRIEEALQTSTAFLVYVGKSGVKGWVDREVRFALSRNVKEKDFPIIPVLGPGSNQTELPSFLMQHQYLDLRSGIKDNKKIKEILDVILEKPSVHVSVLKENESPFLGLLAFQEEHSHLFFGRDKEIDALLKKLGNAHFLAVLGDSGSGKSSLLRAGLIPALKRGRSNENMSWQEDWRIVIVRPGNDPFRQLAYGLLDIDPSLKGAERLKLVEECVKQLQDGVDGLANIVASLVPSRKRVLILVDQFEELFTLCPGIENLEKRHRFIDTLITAANVKGDRPIIHIVVALRVDFYSYCWEHSSLPIYIANNQFAVTQMSPDSLKEAIQEPVTLSKCYFEVGLVDTILSDIGNEPGNLPLLQHALHLLWNKRDVDKLTHQAYKEIGEVKGAIAMHAENIYQNMTSFQKEAARKIFIRLTSLGEGTQDTRRRATLKELIPYGDTTEITLKTIELLASEGARLITLSRESLPVWHENGVSLTKIPRQMDESIIVEVSHEALISHWPRLGDWLNEDRESLLVHRRITQATNEWLKSIRDESLLYPKTKLAEAEVYAQKYTDALSKDEREFIEASILARETEVLQRVAAKIEKLISLISSTSGHLEMDKLLSMTLTVISMEEGLGFDRSVFFSLNEDDKALQGETAVRLVNYGDELEGFQKSIQNDKTMEEIIHEIDTGQFKKDLFLENFIKEIKIPIKEESIFFKMVKDKNPLNIKDAKHEPLTEDIIEILKKLKCNTGIIIPLIVEAKPIGFIWADRFFSKKPITQEDLQLIIEFSKYIASAIQIARLYEQLSLTKESLQSLVDNSADAIVTSDLNGIITSWNKAAERTYGFTEEETLGKYLPFVPDFIDDLERENVEKLKNGQVLKNIETFRKRKDGTIIEVSLSLSPITNIAGEVIGINCISRDITERKLAEKEMVRRSEELSRLFFISSAMRGTFELDRLLRMVLTTVTTSNGLGFNRAILLLIDEKKNILKGVMGEGPASQMEAEQIGERLSLEKKTLSDIMHEIETGHLKKDSFFDRLSLSIEIPLTEETVLTKAVKEKKPFNIQNVKEELLSDPVLIQQLDTQAYAVVPLISRDKVIGVFWVDNYFNKKPVVEEDIRFLTVFSNHIATAIEQASLFGQVSLAEQELENIFESISDMVYFITKDYVVKSINTAVSKRLGKPPEEIVGKKCYEIFHGTNGPWAECPHHKTAETRKAFVKEVEDPHLGGTFITSSSPIFDTTGEFIGTVNVVRDITELRNLRERLIKAERMAVLGEVAAKVAHEIRTPLVSVGGFARRLKKNLQGNLKEYADIIAKEVERLEGILNEILSFVKETRVVREIVNSNRLIEEVISLIKSDLDERSIVLVREFSEPAEIYIDTNMIKEALLNILSNAIQAIGSNGTIFVKTYIKDNATVFEIKDTGVGISKEDLPFIFDPFFTTKKANTGLGLTITHRIIEEHHGNIEVESMLGLGSTFRVFIPLKKQ